LFALASIPERRPIVNTLTAAQEGLETGTWQLDPVHSRVGFSVDYMAGTFYGSFAPFQATLEVTGDGTATLSGLAPVTSVQVQDENLAAHLQSPEFFDAERAPEISFASKPFAVGPTFRATGELTIKSISLPVELGGTINGPIVDPYGRQRVNLAVEATVDRTAFGLEWNTPLPSGEPALANDVTISAELALVREA
jgi:polyisoprenoid-binding protein YceI